MKLEDPAKRLSMNDVVEFLEKLYIEPKFIKGVSEDVGFTSQIRALVGRPEYMKRYVESTDAKI